MPDPHGDYFISRKRMVREQLLSRGIRHPAVLSAMLKVPRHLFVEEGMHPMAYNDHPLHIGQSQTISQPYIVAAMLEALQIRSSDRVLEVGTGSGYLTAVLAELVQHVYTVELLSALMFKARRVLKQLAYRNITLKLGDGTVGWSAQAPFDKIVVSAGGPKVPEPYMEQLAEGGRMVIPVGDSERQQLTLVTKERGRHAQQVLSGCRFVKLKGRYGFAAS